MKIVVCVKQVFDPTAPASAFEVDGERKRALPPKGSPPVLNPYDENALEAALKIKDRDGAEITVLSLGAKLARMVLLKTLAAGADRLILLEDGAFEQLDSHATACFLAKAIQRAGGADLVLCGRQAADTDAGQVGLGIAEILGIPSVTVAREVRVGDGKALVEREAPGGYELVEAPLPCLVTAGSEVGDMRFPPIKALVEAKKKDVPVWTAADLGLDAEDVSRTVVLDLLPAPARPSRCERITATSAARAGEALADRLRMAGLV